MDPVIVVLGLAAIASGLVAILCLILFCLSKAAAKGNVYCPSCGSEDKQTTIHYENGDTKYSRYSRTTYVCNCCGKEWGEDGQNVRLQIRRLEDR